VSLARDDLTRTGLHRAHGKLAAALQQAGPVNLDLAAIDTIDSAGVVLLQQFVRRARREGKAVAVTGAKETVAEALRIFPYLEPPAPQPAPRVPMLESVGAAAAQVWDVVTSYAALVRALVIFLARGVRHGRGLRRHAVLLEMANKGSQALGVVGLISFLVGATVALQSATQLRQFGANLFVADLIGVSITRELGPLMAAIVVAGRSGSAVAAEVATMVITEEVDALRTMGIGPKYSPSPSPSPC
jgi:phospholipid/cholesterol/gamma-HCH transport system permease protein